MNVLITDKSPSRQTAIYSFCGAIGVSLILCLSWWLMQPTAPRIPLQRHLSDQELRWRCPDGHEFVRKGSYNLVPCPVCGRRADVMATYVCPEHGPKPALIRYELESDGREKVSSVSFRPMVWQRVDGAIRCSECGSAMAPQRSNPFDKLPAKRRRGD